MNEWSVECGCVAGEWMSGWSVDGMNVIVLHGLRAAWVGGWAVLGCYEAYIYILRWECVRRPERSQRERETRERRQE